MKKLRLDPEHLAVEPFEVEAAGGALHGTVAANDAEQHNRATAHRDSCGYPNTCGGTSCDTGYPLCYQCTTRCAL
ncbi:MAG TPA: hypothetical protein VFJ16_02645 [Longimicrobium sp.]|nr:hypothetical protein [Longimicrobium sp.]